MGLTELLVILGIAILVFGTKRVGELGKSVGSGIRSFKEGLDQGDADAEAARAAREKEAEPPEMRALPPKSQPDDEDA